MKYFISNYMANKFYSYCVAKNPLLFSSKIKINRVKKEKSWCSVVAKDNFIQ